MQQTYSLKEKIKQFIVILLPILVTQLSLFGMVFFNTIMSGQAGPQDLAGVAIGSSLWVPVSTGLTGILLAITPLVAQLLGSGRKDRIPFTVIQGIYLAVVIALLIIFSGILAIRPILGAMSLEAAVRQIAQKYLVAISFGILPMFIYTVLRCFIDALGQTRVTMLITIISLPINISLNYLLIFGNFGFPRLGGIGAGVSSAITYWCILFIGLYVVSRVAPFKKYGIFQQFYAASLKAWLEQLKLGIPIGLAIFMETGLFCSVTLLMSQFNTITIAAHQAAMNFYSLLFMIPLGISMALTINVGFEVGAKRFEDAKQYSRLGLGIALGLAVCAGIIIYLFNNQVSGLYSRDPAVRELTQRFLLFALFFLLSDAIATPVQGILRGYKDVNITTLVTFVSFWVVGLPLGHYLATSTELAAFGYWIGLITGLALVAVGLSIRMIILQRKEQEFNFKSNLPK